MVKSAYITSTPADTDRHRPGIVDLHRQTGHKRNRPRLRTGHVIPSEPAVRKLVIRAETRKHAQPHPETVIELMRHIRMRRRPQTGLGIGGLPAAVIHPGIDRPRGHMKIEPPHDPRTGKLRHPRGIVRQRRRIIRPADHTASQRKPARTPPLQREIAGPHRITAIGPDQTGLTGTQHPTQQHPIPLLHTHPRKNPSVPHPVIPETTEIPQQFLQEYFLET